MFIEAENTGSVKIIVPKLKQGIGHACVILFICIYLVRTRNKRKLQNKKFQTHNLPITLTTVLATILFFVFDSNLYMYVLYEFSAWLHGLDLLVEKSAFSTALTWQKRYFHKGRALILDTFQKGIFLYQTQFFLYQNYWLSAHNYDSTGSVNQRSNIPGVLGHWLAEPFLIALCMF